jgi:hypothetical protein
MGMRTGLIAALLLAGVTGGAFAQRVVRPDGTIEVRRPPKLAGDSMPTAVEGTSATGLWSSLGTGTNSVVWAIAVSGDGIYAGGQFTSAGGAGTNRIARWDGTSWSALSTGVTGALTPVVYAVTVSGADVYAGGFFSSAGGVPANGIAKWNGASWSAFGNGVTTISGAGTVAGIALDGANVYAGGSFSTAGTVAASNVARWNGSAWEALGQGVNAAVWAVTRFNGQIYIAGDFTLSGTTQMRRVARWTGSAWEEVGGGLNGSAYTFAQYGGNLYAGGAFTEAGGQPASAVAVWNGSVWQPLGAGVAGLVSGLSAGNTGVYAGGTFLTAGGVTCNSVAKWTGSAWENLGGGINLYANAVAASGDNVYFGGEFNIADAQPVGNIAKWSEGGITLTPLLTGWNMVSVPRVPSSFSVDALFPGRTGSAFGFDNASQAYTVPSVLANGQGYWVKYPSPTSVTISGAPLGSIQVTATSAGWVMLGSVTDPAPINSLATTPPGSITGQIFGWNRSTQAYIVATGDIVPAEGYWVKVTQPCLITIP